MRLSEAKGFFAISLIAIFVVGKAAAAETSHCDKPLYLTFDTGHMEIAPFVADVLKRKGILVTFFAADEKTKLGDSSLSSYWAPWWHARAVEGHAFASHTMDHTYWRADAGTKGTPMFKVRSSAGPQAGKDLAISAAQYCEEIGRASTRLHEITGKAPLPLFRAPGGKISPTLLTAAKSCGYAHVGWSPAGFLGDELPSAQFSNAALLKKALDNIRSGDILLAHLGIWSRKDPWAPAVLEPLIDGLKQRGFCFRTLADHPDYRGWLAGKR
ncbi:polysaccharide deacetylase family protein [Acidovorax sp. SUPP3334]|uniref:polysaccharide deacetylase family protein n=1 Tax=Acidovorax sp. SUPP3334 TaxID=2920881 RepID=UPI0023DE26D8|nr:polysaccharide deacetylase family protein [Acidovorax sp. SUPP3334]GKT26168.1 polysaccharide deacetylase family protein [Acidovorax sp. SUPP3334]